MEQNAAEEQDFRLLTGKQVTIKLIRGGTVNGKVLSVSEDYLTIKTNEKKILKIHNLKVESASELNSEEENDGIINDSKKVEIDEDKEEQSDKKKKDKEKKKKKDKKKKKKKK
ncbi:hypothetical protein MM300_10395 [Evansella sp. LMS18]|jgi:uncharacterized membrane protein YukC|uniref:hypothetical protein n=1 Tax=Evansella sp. LMS18 TaxID=2924033 RepID=UPI0020D047D0|nr:hypothetical protein [Evansella sp. LMS18]UTR12644.1 hypothetical protein MM300_10395 [Evansella sp. LMS18]